MCSVSQEHGLRGSAENIDASARRRREADAYRTGKISDRSSFPAREGAHYEAPVVRDSSCSRDCRRSAALTLSTARCA